MCTAHHACAAQQSSIVVGPCTVVLPLVATQLDTNLVLLGTGD